MILFALDPQGLKLALGIVSSKNISKAESKGRGVKQKGFPQGGNLFLSEKKTIPRNSSADLPLYVPLVRIGSNDEGNWKSKYLAKGNKVALICPRGPSPGIPFKQWQFKGGSLSKEEWKKVVFERATKIDFRKKRHGVYRKEETLNK